MAHDFEKDNFTVDVHDSGVPSGGRFVAKVLEYKEGNFDKFVTRYAYGLTKDEALENAQKLIAELS